jgi:hypothetical protein
VPVESTVKAPDGQGIVSVEGNKVTGRAVGDVPVTVSAGGQTATVNVHVSAADSLEFDPPALDLQPSESHAVAVMGKGADGQKVAVQAQIESMDKNVVDADPAQPGQFVAHSQGQTQLHAVYRGKEVFAKVTVSGRRFETVTPTLNNLPGNNAQFDVAIDVLAAASEGELEYRVFAKDANPADNWVKNGPAEGEKRKVTLTSDKLNFGPRGQIYQLVLEARDTATQRIEKYPLNLQLESTYSITVVPNNAPPPVQPIPIEPGNSGKETPPKDSK